MSGHLNKGDDARRLSDITNTGASSGGGGFAFDETTMQTIINKWVNLADNYQNSIDVADQMIRVGGPGLDAASKSHAIAANKSGEAYLDYLRRNREYCVQQGQIFQDTLASYLDIESVNLAEIDRTRPDGLLPKAR